MVSALQSLNAQRPRRRRLIRNVVVLLVAQLDRSEADVWQR